MIAATEGGDCGGGAGGRGACCDRWRRLWRRGWPQGVLRPTAETVEKGLAAGGAAADGGDCGEEAQGSRRCDCCGSRNARAASRREQAALRRGGEGDWGRARAASRREQAALGGGEGHPGKPQG